MSKPREIPGLSTELPFGEAAARVLEVRCQELMDHSENVLDIDRIEGVHDMRVATRRLRAAIEVFWQCFPAKPRKKVLAEVKALADALGERRDRDVAIAVLRDFSESMPHPDRPGISSLVDEFEAEQQVANNGLAGNIEAARLEQLRGALQDLAEAARAAANEGEEE